MAIYPKKSKDPTEVALSAIQDALNVRETDTAAADCGDDRDGGRGLERQPQALPRVAPVGRDRRSTPR